MAENSIIYTDKWKAYDGLVLDGYKHYRINHSKDFAHGKNHINGIENFWGWSKARLAKLKGIKRSRLYWHLKECEFRFNHRHLSNKMLYAKLLNIFKGEDLN